jgi:hypothetical protein
LDAIRPELDWLKEEELSLFDQPFKDWDLDVWQTAMEKALKAQREGKRKVEKAKDTQEINNFGMLEKKLEELIDKKLEAFRGEREVPLSDSRDFMAEPELALNSASSDFDQQPSIDPTSTDSPEKPKKRKKSNKPKKGSKKSRVVESQEEELEEDTPVVPPEESDPEHPIIILGSRSPPRQLATKAANGKQNLNPAWVRWAWGFWADHSDLNLEEAIREYLKHVPEKRRSTHEGSLRPLWKFSSARETSWEYLTEKCNEEPMFKKKLDELKAQGWRMENGKVKRVI